MGRGEPWKLSNDNEKRKPENSTSESLWKTSKDESQQELNKGSKVGLSSRKAE